MIIIHWIFFGLCAKLSDKLTNPNICSYHSSPYTGEIQTSPAGWCNEKWLLHVSLLSCGLLKNGAVFFSLPLKNWGLWIGEHINISTSQHLNHWVWGRMLGMLPYSWTFVTPEVTKAWTPSVPDESTTRRLARGSFWRDGVTVMLSWWKWYWG